MKPITMLQAFELIDLAANEDRLYHYNGGQAYIRISMNLNVLMILDNTSIDHPSIQFMDGTEYFKQCVPTRLWLTQSQCLEGNGSLAQWYISNYQQLQGV